MLTAEEISQRYQLPPERARIVGAGAFIIHAVMERFKLTEIHVSTYGIREGILLAYARYGEQWLQQIKHSVEAAGTSNTDRQEDEKFAQSGRRLLQVRAHKMLEWREEVLKHEDVEAVHKMRVASRRLRAVLDAYESACSPKQFKKVYRHIREMADILGLARDTDVMLENLRGRLAQIPREEQAGVEWLLERLATYRQEHQKRLEAFLQDFDDAAFLEQIAACLPEEE